MAASYWESTQYKNWTFSRTRLATIRKTAEEATAPIVAAFPLPDRRLLHLYFWHQLAKLGKNAAPGNRQQILATAQVLIRRFYLKVDIRDTNPFAVLTTAFYLASKVEECPVHLRQIYTEARQTWPDVMLTSSARLAEYEFAMISQLRSQLMIHHPYRTLLELRNEFKLTQDELTVSWCIVNDHYVTDLPFLFPPYIIAFTSILLALVITLTGNVNLPPTPGTTATVPTPAGTAGQSNSFTGGSGAIQAIHLNGMSNSFNSPLPYSSASAPSIGTLTAAAAAQMHDRSQFSSLLLPLENGLVAIDLPDRVEDMLEAIGTSEINLQDMVECAQEMMGLYQVWDHYREGECRELLVRLVRGRGMDK